MYPVVQNNTIRPLDFLMVLSADHVSPATGLSPTVTLSKNGAPFAPAAGSVSETGNGWYSVAPNVTDNAVLGPLLLHAVADTADPTDEQYIVVPLLCGSRSCYDPTAGSQYIYPADLASFYDSRRVLQLAVDSTTPALITDLSNPLSAAYMTVNQCILTAASDIDSYCQVGQRYSPCDLSQMITNWQANPTIVEYAKTAALIRQLTADLAFGVLCARRGYTAETMKAYAPRYEAALVTLERLAEGYQIFNLCDNLRAAIPSVGRIEKHALRPSAWNRMFGVWYVGDGPGSRQWGGGWLS